MSRRPLNRTILLAALLLFPALLPATHAAGETRGIPPLVGLRRESDESLTFLGNIADRPGRLTRFPVVLSSEIVPPEIVEQGVFIREWQEGAAFVTLGYYVRTDNSILNTNVVVIEGLADPQTLARDAFQEEIEPFVLNNLPFLINIVHPSSVPLFFQLALLITAGQLATTMVGQAGYEDFGGSILHMFGWMQFAPLFYQNRLYPYHQDEQGDEVYSDLADLFVWQGIRETPMGRSWDGTYLARDGEYREWIEGQPGDHILVADAWKRDISGSAVRLDEETTRSPGLYVRHDIHRAYRPTGAVDGEFAASSVVTAGIFAAQTGEAPLARVELEEDKAGPHQMYYTERQDDRVTIGLLGDDAFVPLLGVRTEATHRWYVDIDNQGNEVPSIEARRLTSTGVYDGASFVPVLGSRYWGERNPLDFWATLFANQLHGLGDQTIGDMSMDVGVFVGGEYSPISGATVDDDFVGHSHTHRMMVSHGVFQGEVFLPLWSFTYDGDQTSSVWLSSQRADQPSGAGSFMLSVGVLGGSAYIPLLGMEHLALSTGGGQFLFGVFAGSYSAFVPVAVLTYEGEHTFVVWSSNVATGPSSRRGSADLSAGVAPDVTTAPLVGVGYDDRGTAGRPFGHTAELRYFDMDGDPAPLARISLGTSGEPLSLEWLFGPDSCSVGAAAALPLAGFTITVEPPCVANP